MRFTWVTVFLLFGNILVTGQIKREEIPLHFCVLIV